MYEEAYKLILCLIMRRTVGGQLSQEDSNK